MLLQSTANDTKNKTRHSSVNQNNMHVPFITTSVYMTVGAKTEELTLKSLIKCQNERNFFKLTDDFWY